MSSHSIKDSSSCQTQLFNSTRVSFPCIIAPTAFQRLANYEHGELATVRAAVACSTIMCASTNASTSLERIAEEHRRYMKEKYPQSTSQLWFQLYVAKDRRFTQRLIERAETSGYSALLITVDTPELGHREGEIRHKFTLPDGIHAANILKEDNTLATSHRDIKIDTSLSWKDLDWIRSITKLPIILKGIIHPEDAVQAARCGVKAIVVSNHGGRQLDTCQAGIDALPSIMTALRGGDYQIDVYVDGGIRRGTDILKALAMGAKAVLIGRPVLWGLAVDGEQGVTKILQLLKEELRLSMVLCGCQTVDDIKRNNLLVLDNGKRSKL